MSNDGTVPTADKAISANKVLVWLREQGRQYNQEATNLTRMANGMSTLASIDYRSRADEVFRIADRLERKITSGNLDMDHIEDNLGMVGEEE